MQFGEFAENIEDALRQPTARKPSRGDACHLHGIDGEQRKSLQAETRQPGLRPAADRPRADGARQTSLPDSLGRPPVKDGDLGEYMSRPLVATPPLAQFSGICVVQRPLAVQPPDQPASRTQPDTHFRLLAGDERGFVAADIVQGVNSYEGIPATFACFTRRAVPLAITQCIAGRPFREAFPPAAEDDPTLRVGLHMARGVAEPGRVHYAVAVDAEKSGSPAASVLRCARSR